MTMQIRIVVLIFIAVLSVNTAAGDCGPDLSAGFHPRIVHTTRGYAGFVQLLTAFHPETNERMAYVEYAVDRAWFIDLKDVKVLRPEWKRHGLSRLLLTEMLKRNPKTERVAALLAMDNLQAYKDARREGEPCLEALKKTPMFKAVARLGFDKIDRSFCGATSPMGYWMTLAKSR